MRGIYEHADPILVVAREFGADGGTLADVLKEISPWGEPGRIPHGTEGLLIAASLAGLVACDLITISENSTNVGNEMLRKHDQANGYAIAQYLRERDANKLVVKLSLLQKD